MANDGHNIAQNGVTQNVVSLGASLNIRFNI